MTFINYLTRVHFADGVLEEALRAEMERLDRRRPLIVAEQGHLSGAIAERFFSSFPIRARVETFTAAPGGPTEQAAREITRIYRLLDCDLLIAFGSNRAMDLAKTARISIAYDEPIQALSSEEGGAHRISSSLPPLFSLPGILGFASAITDYTRVKLDEGRQVLLSSPHLIPNVTICDPTLTLGASPWETACAAAGIFARAVDGYLAPSYNPPAEGMALDALSRVAANLDRVLASDDLVARREMMAAGLNSSMALQKGLCPVHAISNAVASMSAVPIDPSALGGVLIPVLTRFYADQGIDRLDRIHAALALDGTEPVADGIAHIIRALPLAATLSDLGVERADLPVAADLATSDRAIANGPVMLTSQDVLEILGAVYGAPGHAHAEHA